MSAIIKDKYFKDADELRNVFFQLFWCRIHIPYDEYKKLKQEEIISLKIRTNDFIFDGDTNE